MTSSRKRDAWQAALIGVIAGCTCMVFSVSWDGTPHFFQDLFGPSVMLGCGRGFVNPAPGAVPELDAFIHPEMHVNHPPVMDCFDCARLPEDVPEIPLGSFQRRQRYLLLAVGWLWRALGVRWSALTPLYGLLFGASAAVLFGLFRLAVPRFIAWPAVLLLVFSPIQLNNLVRLRDYSKAPFILGAILLLAWLVKRPFARGRLFGVSALCGVVLGVGMGFRMDVLICVPAFVLVVFLFLEGPLTARLREKVAAVAIFLAVFFVAGFPILTAMGTSMKYQDFMLGLNDLYDSRLGVGGVPYQINHRYFDREPFATLEAYAVHRTGAPGFYDWDTPEVEAAGRRFTREVIRTFPADLMMRALAATLRTVDELNSSPRHPAPRGIDDAILRHFYDAHAWIVFHGLRYARYAVVLALLLLSAFSLRHGLAALFFLLYFGGYGAVQFASRHYFHMQFLSFWAVAFCLAAVAAIVRYPITRERAKDASPLLPKHGAKGAILRVAVFSVIAVVGIFVPLQALRIYQTGQVRKVLEAYEAAPRTGLSFHTTSQENGFVLVQSDEGAKCGPQPDGPPCFNYDYLVAEFDSSEGAVPFLVRYEGSSHDVAFTWTGTIPRAEGGPVRLYFPAYYARWRNTDHEWTRYKGLELAPEFLPRLRSLDRVDHPERFTFLLTATLAPDWREKPLYQRLTR